MTAQARSPRGAQGVKKATKRGIWVGIIVIVLALMVLGTKFVRNDDPLLQGGEAKFNAKTFGTENFPKVRDQIVEKAAAAPELAAAISADPEAAAKDYGQETSGGPIFPVTATGVVGEGASGIYELKVDDVPEGLLIRMQTGPAINGTELRDATGEYPFGDFENQIAYQDSAAALNNAMKDEVLAGIDAGSLEGKTVTVTGAFTLVNPEAWLITPVELKVQ